MHSMRNQGLIELMVVLFDYDISIKNWVEGGGGGG